VSTPDPCPGYRTTRAAASASLAGCSTSATTRLAMNRADGLACARDFNHLDNSATRSDLDATPRARRDDLVGTRTVVCRHHDLDAVTLHVLSLVRSAHDGRRGGRRDRAAATKRLDDALEAGQERRGAQVWSPGTACPRRRAALSARPHASVAEWTQPDVTTRSAASSHSPKSAVRLPDRSRSEPPRPTTFGPGTAAAVACRPHSQAGWRDHPIAVRD
jgi:hypothetical protein